MRPDLFKAVISQVPFVDILNTRQIVQRHLASQPMETVYDALMLPALNYAERDRIEGRLSEEDEHTVTEQTRELLGDVERFESALPPADAPEQETTALKVPRAHGFAHSGGRAWLPGERSVRCNRAADAGAPGGRWCDPAGRDFRAAALVGGDRSSRLLKNPP